MVQSSSANFAGSSVPGANAWRNMATMPGWDRRAKRASAAVGNGERKKAATRAVARSRRVIGSCVRRSGNWGRLDETSAEVVEPDILQPGARPDCTPDMVEGFCFSPEVHAAEQR